LMTKLVVMERDGDAFIDGLLDGLFDSDWDVQADSNDCGEISNGLEKNDR
jgi:hypothetical protein